MSWWTDFRNTVLKIAPIIISVAIPGLGLAIGEALGATGAAASAIGAATISGTSTALQGGNLEQVLESAAGAGAGSFASSALSGAFPSGATQAENAYQAGMPGGTQIETSLLDPSKIVPATAGGAVSGGTQALLGGKSVGEGLLKGAETGAIKGTAGSVGNYVSSQLPDTLSARLGGGAATGATQAGLSGQNPFIGAIAGAAGGGAGYTYGQATGTDVPVSFDQQISNLISGNATPSGPTGTSPVSSSVTTGSPAPSTAATGADIAMLDTTTPDSVGGKLGKKGGKYPWGTPEGTTALKEGLGV